MELIDKELLELLKSYPLDSQDNKGKDAMVLAKFYRPFSCCRWYVMEAEFLENNDILFFGLVATPIEIEYGGFYLMELVECAVQRDMLFKPTMLRNINDKDIKEFINNKYV